MKKMKYAYKNVQKKTFSEQLAADRKNPAIRPQILFLEMFNTMVKTAGGTVMMPTRSVNIDTGGVDYRVHYKTPAGDRLDVEARRGEIAFWFRPAADLPAGWRDDRPVLLLAGDGKGASTVVPTDQGATTADAFTAAVYGFLRRHVPLDWDRPLPNYSWAP